jgi:Na+-driven multidrug efflux pump
LIGYFILGVPFSIICVHYYDMGMNGLWLGPTVAITFNFLVYMVFIVRADWDRIMEEARISRLSENK